jgi:excisionase family DNA binding protein
MTNIPGYLTTDEAAAMIGGVSGDWVSILCKNGTLDCTKVGNTWLVTESSVKAYQRTRRKPGRPKR